MKIFFAICTFLILITSIKAIPFKTVKVTDNVYAFISEDPTREWVDCNSIAVITDEGVFVVDSRTTPALAEELINRIKEITDQPVKYVLNTHWHYDHNLGNQVFVEKYPGCNIIAQVQTKKRMDYHVPRHISQSLQALPDYVNGLEEKFNKGLDADGRKLSPFEIKRTEIAIADAKKHMGQYNIMKYVAPTITFKSILTFNMGGTDIEILSYGRGNTDGDAFVYLPQQKIIITGDLLVNPVPYAFGSYYYEWVEYLKKMRKLDAEIIIPGHGEVEYSKDYLTTVTNLFESLLKQMQSSYDNGLSFEEAKKKLDLEDFRKKICGNDPAKNWAFNNYFMPEGNLKRVFNEVKGELKNEKLPFND